MPARHGRRHAACPSRVSSHSHLRAPSGSGTSWLGGVQRPARHASGLRHWKLALLPQQPPQPCGVCHAVPTEDLDLIDQLLADIEPPPAATPPVVEPEDTPATKATTSIPTGAGGPAPSRLLQRLRGKRNSTSSKSSSSRAATSSQDPQPDIPRSPAARKQPARRAAAAAAAAAPKRPSGVIQLTGWDSDSSEQADVGVPRTRGNRAAAGAEAAAAPGLPISSPWQALRQEMAAAKREERRQAAAAAAAAAAEAAAAAAQERRKRLVAQAEQPPLPAVRRALGRAAAAAGEQGSADGSGDLPLVRSTRGRSSRASRGPAPPAAAAATAGTAVPASSPAAAAAARPPDDVASPAAYSVDVAGGATAAAAMTPMDVPPQASAVGVLTQQQQQQQQAAPAVPEPTSSSKSSSSMSSRQRPAARRGSRAAAATAAVAAARAGAAAAGLLGAPTTGPPQTSAPSGSRAPSRQRGRRAVPVHSLGPITHGTWQEAGQAAFPTLFDSSWHTSLYALLVDLCGQLLDWQQQQQLEQEEEQQQAARQSGSDQLSPEQQAMAGWSDEDQQAPYVPAGSTRTRAPNSGTGSDGQVSVDVDQIGGFLAACLSSSSMYAQLSAGLALASRAACRPLVLQPLGPHLAPPLLQHTLLPCVSLLAPDAVVEVLRVLRRLHPAARLAPSPSRELLAALGQLEGLLGVYPGADLGLLVHVAPAHGLLQD